MKHALYFVIVLLAFPVFCVLALLGVLVDEQDNTHGGCLRYHYRSPRPL